MDLIIKKRVRRNGGYEFDKTHINSEEDLLDWINSNLASIDKYVKVRSEIVDAVNKIESISHKKFQNLLKSLNKGSCHRSKIKYWIDRGYTEQEAIEQVSLHQSKISIGFAKKRKANPGKYKGITTTQVEYWTKAGYTDEEAIELVRERQKTFSLDKCIEKYGEIEGLRRWEARQAKWLESRSRSLKEGLWDTKSQAAKRPHFKIDNLVEDFGSGWIDEHIKRNRRLNTSTKKMYTTLSNLVKSGSSLDDFITSLPFHDLLEYSRTAVFKHLIGDSNPIEIWCMANGTKFQRNPFGNQYWFKGHYLKSNGEFEIALWLDSNDIEFKTNDSYPNSRRAFDFYLPDFDLYVELAGMRDRDYIEKRNFLSEVPYKVIWVKCLSDLKQYMHEENN